MRIALDLFGGDFAPDTTIQGAILACETSHAMEIDNLRVTLVGDCSKLTAAQTSNLGNNIELYDVPGEFYKNDSAPHAAGKDERSPIRTSLRLHREGKFDAVVSAGSTGAQVVASLKELGTCTGIYRPAIGVLLPTGNGLSLLLDVGASLVAGPKQLVQFAVMGYLYLTEILGNKNPRIGLLNVGKESGVGPRSVRIANSVLRQSKFEYAGFIEGNDILTGEVDVIVTNGLVGNILLKYTEGFPVFLKNILPDGKASMINAKISKMLDYQQFGGVPLLGINGVSVIGHGSSSAQALSSAILKAGSMIKADFHNKIESFMANELENYVPSSLTAI
jgi:glycerol-3-phosphate acyltransferase PlsX